MVSGFRLDIDFMLSSSCSKSIIDEVDGLSTIEGMSIPLTVLMAAMPLPLPIVLTFGKSYELFSIPPNICPMLFP